MTSTPSSNDALATIPSDRLWLRSELMGTQVITRDTGRRLGVVGEVIVDIDRREVVAVGLRDNPLTRFLPGLPRWMPLDRIRQVGDVILVDSADSLSEGFNPERYSRVINQVITESGRQLGRVLGFAFGHRDRRTHHAGDGSPRCSPARRGRFGHLGDAGGGDRQQRARPDHCL